MLKVEATNVVPVELLLRREVLNLGCGHRHVADAVNLDITPATRPDLVHDLNQRPWPLPDNHFREVLAYDLIEHLDETIATLEEIHRVSSDGAIIRLTVPHFSCSNAFTDPTHRHCFGRFSFDCLTQGDEHDYYTSARFRQRSCRIIFHPTLLNKLVWRIANRYPSAYERRWAWIFPAWFMSIELEVLKRANNRSSDEPEAN
jgi:hypothetical protein